MESGRDILFTSSLPGDQQTPCDTLPVPQNLVVSRHRDTADKPITGGHTSTIDDSSPDAASSSSSSLASAMDLGQQTLDILHRDSPTDWLRLDSFADHDMHDGTHGAVVSTTGSPDNPGGQSNRKLCVRHKRMADEGTNVAMQQVSQSSSRL
jgi:hypothetical protein